MSQLETVLPTSIIRFRITLSRTTAADKSPVFEMIRVRFPIILDAFGPLLEPVIRFIPTWDVEQEIRNNYGSNVDASGKNFWTLPLNFFDAALLPDTAESRIIDDAFVECRYGGMIGFRYAMNQFKYSDTFGKMTHQAFVLRKVAGKPNKLVGEHFYRVF
jgi:hypothetical protein